MAPDLNAWRAFRLLTTLLAATAAAEAAPFAGLWPEEMVSTSRDDRSIWLAWYPKGVVASDTFKTSAFLRFDCRVADANAIAPSVPLRAVLYVPRLEDEPDVPSVFNPLYWIRGLTGREFERIPVQATINGGDPAPATLVVRRISYSITRPEHQLEGLPAAQLLAKAAASSEPVVLRLSGDGRLPGRIEFDPHETSAAAAGAMLEHCP